MCEGVLWRVGRGRRGEGGGEGGGGSQIKHTLTQKLELILKTVKSTENEPMQSCLTAQLPI